MEFRVSAPRDRDADGVEGMGCGEVVLIPITGNGLWAEGYSTALSNDTHAPSSENVIFLL